VVIIKAIVFVICSVILIHLAGLFGVFVVAAYPVWWLIAPQKTPCLFCRWQKIGRVCNACKCEVKDHKHCYPQNFRSVFLNMVVLLIASIISLLVILLETKIFSYYGISPVSKSVSFTIPAKGEYLLGEIFPMEVNLTGVKTNINTVRADISFDPEKLEVMGITTSNSFATIFVQKEIDNQVGFARISGGIPNPGADCNDSTDICHFASFIFKTKKPGTVQVKYLPTSLVLANDGRGSSVLKDFGSTSLLILPDKVSGDEENEQKGSLSLNVLGSTATDSSGQLLLYQGNSVLETSVLGTSIEAKSENTNGIQAVFVKILTFINTYDRFILDFWKKIFTP